MVAPARLDDVVAGHGAGVVRTDEPASGPWLRRVGLPEAVPGRLWFHSMPGRFESWAAFGAQAQRAGLQWLVCLTPMHEVSLLSPAYGRAVADGTLPWRWKHLPMRDLGLASNGEAFTRGVDEIAGRLAEGASVLVHCAAGIGRTGTFGACVLKRLGLPRDEALAAVRRAGAQPESAVQGGLIDRF